MSVSRKIREERKRLGLTQGELAEKLGVSQGTISRWESGVQSPDFASLLKLGDISDVDVVKLSFGGEEEHPYERYPDWGEVKVVGAVNEGVWIERPEWESDDHFSVNVPPNLSEFREQVRGFLVRDNSAEPAFVRDSIIFVLPVDFRTTILKSHDFLLVSEENESGLVEVTLRETYDIGDGLFTIDALPNNLAFPVNHKLIIRPDGSAIGESPYADPLKVLGLVVSSFRLEPALTRAAL